MTSLSATITAGPLPVPGVTGSSQRCEMRYFLSTVNMQGHEVDLDIEFMSMSELTLFASEQHPGFTSLVVVVLP